MSPKKSKKTSEVGVYDVEIMNDGELRDYIGVLTEETERMKLLLVYLERGQQETTNLLQNTNQEILNKIETTIQKDVAVQNQVIKSFDKIKENERKNLIAELELKVNDAKCDLNAFEKIQLTKLSQRNENLYLQKEIEGRVKEDAKNNQDSNYILSDCRDTEEQCIASTTENTNILKSIAKKGVQTYNNTTYGFQKEKVKKMIDILEHSDVPSLEHSISDYAEELSFYFDEILSKNMETTTTLKNEVNKLEHELNKLQLQIRDAKRENMQLKTNQPGRKNHPESDEEFGDQVETKVETIVDKKNEAQLEELVFENDVLHEKLRSVTKERDDLRSRFLTAKRKVYQKADFKIFLLEQILKSIQNKKKYLDKYNDSSSIVYATLPKRKRTTQNEESS